jgi:hypothetical protein
MERCRGVEIGATGEGTLGRLLEREACAGAEAQGTDLGTVAGGRINGIGKNMRQ